ncbi:hypothetical protein Y032_0060g3115 [Ancylostoma ceylanicum]|uniref:Uncharacterized protein n=1 Tax=Ancylostoma ceylanicum TaxID=53326 RepID=A0A016U2T7_9BILA|nr:hypothetical protein Y032_0060g3115 [Ancylostoma ceylanicum]
MLEKTNIRKLKENLPNANKFIKHPRTNAVKLGMTNTGNADCQQLQLQWSPVFHGAVLQTQVEASMS